MAGYASGKYANAICPRCGFKCKYKELKQEWTGLWVCPTCYDPKHPKLTPARSLSDPTALHHPYPDTEDDWYSTVFAADFDGTNDYLSRSSSIPLLRDGGQALISFWVRLDGGNGSEQVIFSDSNSRIRVSRNSSNAFQFVAKNSSDTTLVDLSTSSAYTSGSTWYHVIASWSFDENAKYLYVNDTSVLTTNTFTSGTIDYTDTSYAVGAGTDGSSKLNGCLAEVYINLDAYLDLSAKANRRLFYTNQGKPLSAGTYGNNPVGRDPHVYLRGKYDVFGYNYSSTGAHFTETGSLSEASSSPSD